MKRTAASIATVFSVALLCSCTGIVDGIVGGGDDDSAGDGDDRTLEFYYGPMKPMFAESILYSMERITGHDYGEWDYTAPDPGSQAFVDSNNGAGAWYPHCRLLGGCMEHRIPLGRTSFVGTAYVLQLEKAASEGCYDRAAFGHFPGGVAPSAAVQPIDIIEHQYALALGSKPSNTDVEHSIAYFDAHLADPEFNDVSALESAGRGHCRALLTTNRFLFY